MVALSRAYRYRADRADPRKVDHAAAAAPWINKPNNVFIYSAAAEAVDFRDEENDIKSCAANRLLIGAFLSLLGLDPQIDWQQAEREEQSKDAESTPLLRVKGLLVLLAH